MHLAVRNHLRGKRVGLPWPAPPIGGTTGQFGFVGLLRSAGVA